jgi:hypothetical protein
VGRDQIRLELTNQVRHSPDRADILSRVDIAQHAWADPALDTMTRQLLGQWTADTGDYTHLVAAIPRADGEVTHHHLGASDVVAARNDVYHAHGFSPDASDCQS